MCPPRVMTKMSPPRWPLPKSLLIAKSWSKMSPTKMSPHMSPFHPHTPFVSIIPIRDSWFVIRELKIILEIWLIFFFSDSWFVIREWGKTLKTMLSFFFSDLWFVNGKKRKTKLVFSVLVTRDSWFVTGKQIYGNTAHEFLLLVTRDSWFVIRGSRLRNQSLENNDFLHVTADNESRITNHETRITYY